MLLLNVGVESENIIVTLTEKVTIVTPYYLFVFNNVTTKAVVKTVKSFSDDLSTALSRYNEFAIPTAELFEDQATGQWNYEVYESATETMDSIGLNMIENGKMLLKAAELTLTGHVPTTTYKGYAG